MASMLRMCMKPAGAAARQAVRTKATAAPTQVGSSELASLLKKAEGPWGQLSVTDKTNLYRGVYKQTRAELMKRPDDTMNIVGLIAVSIVGAYALTEAIHHNVNGPAPDTMKQDWKNAERIKQEGRGQNPVYGYGTPK